MQSCLYTIFFKRPTPNHLFGCCEMKINLLNINVSKTYFRGVWKISSSPTLVFKKNSRNASAASKVPPVSPRISWLKYIPGWTESAPYMLRLSLLYIRKVRKPTRLKRYPVAPECHSGRLQRSHLLQVWPQMMAMIRELAASTASSSLCSALRTPSGV